MTSRHLPLVGGGASPDAPSRTPFAPVVPALGLAALHAVALVLVVAGGDLLPVRRWVPVHLATLGVLTNLVLGFSQHFARSLTRAAVPPSRTPLLVANVGILAVLTGSSTGRPPLLALGAVLLAAAVVRSWWTLRGMRRGAPGARFGWVVRVYERAHGAFLHGAVLGALLGTGSLSGAWYASARLAHLHVNVLGWVGLTVLATIVFLGPAMARTRMEPGADVAAARWLRLGASGLTVAVLSLLASGLGGAPGAALRVLAGVLLAGYAAAATAVLLPVLRAAGRSPSVTARAALPPACVWGITLPWIDAAVVSAGAWRFLDAVGAAFLLGALGQVVLATVAFLGPMLRGRDASSRGLVTARIERRAVLRAGVYHLGVFAIVAAVVLDVAGGDGASLASLGRWAVIVSVVDLALAVLAPVRRGSGDQDRRSRAPVPIGPDPVPPAVVHWEHG